MREIKFRAWDYNNEKIIDWEKIIIEKDENESGFTIVVFDDYVGDHYDDFPIMQYTGLKDKNGIEIYEGDIVTNDLYRSEGAVFECYFDSKESAFKLIPIIPRSDGKKERNEDLALQMSSVVDKEVIGNVYEDPELLEVKNNE